MGDQTDKPQISMVDHHIKNEAHKKLTVFEMKVKYKDKEFTVSKVYKDFKVLLYQLKKQYPPLKDFKMPHKKFFSSKNENEMFQERMDALKLFVKILVDLPHIEQNDTFNTFFNLNQPINMTISPAVSSSNIFMEQNKKGDELTQSKVKVTDFQILKVIGGGSYGRVYLVRHNVDQKHYAMKVLEKRMFKDEAMFKQVMEERNILMRNVNHPFLIKMYYSFQTPEKLYMILELVNGGELFYHIQQERQFPEARSKFYAAEIGDAIGYLHRQNIIYRDLKPENILLDCEGHVALTDFGLSKELQSSSEITSTICGTPEYLAPEVIAKEPYDKTVDWWGLGCVLFEMLHGYPPFYSEDRDEMFRNVMENEPQISAACSIPCRSIITHLLKKKPTERLGYGPNDWNDIKGHYFFKDINFEDLLSKKITPPFNPGVKNELDFKNISKEFLNQEITGIKSYKKDSIVCNQNNPLNDEKGESNKFVGFTYVHEPEFD